jgi:hypothetical protein
MISGGIDDGCARVACENKNAAHKNGGEYAEEP